MYLCFLPIFYNSGCGFFLEAFYILRTRTFCLTEVANIFPSLSLFIMVFCCCYFCFAKRKVFLLFFNFCVSNLSVFSLFWVTGQYPHVPSCSSNSPMSSFDACIVSLLTFRLLTYLEFTMMYSLRGGPRFIFFLWLVSCPVPVIKKFPSLLISDVGLTIAEISLPWARGLFLDFLPCSLSMGDAPRF